LSFPPYGGESPLPHLRRARHRERSRRPAPRAGRRALPHGALSDVPQQERLGAVTRGVDLSVSAVVRFSSFVLAALLLAGAAAPARGAPAQTGWIDLSEWDPQRSIVKLSGLWEFYWG